MAEIIVVTSGKGGVGKTTTSASVAAGLAMRGFKTVVIDFDVGLRNLDLVMGCERRVVYDLVNVVHLGTDSTAAKSFVSRQGFGKMKHIEIRNMWLQKEVRDGKVEVSKVPGDKNPADLMTKILNTKDIQVRLDKMGLVATWIKGMEFGEGEVAP